MACICEHCGSPIYVGDKAVRGEMYDTRDPEAGYVSGMFCGRGCAELELPRMMERGRAKWADYDPTPIGRAPCEND